MIVHPSLGATTYKDFSPLPAPPRSRWLHLAGHRARASGTWWANLSAGRRVTRSATFPTKAPAPRSADLLAGHVKLGTMTFSSAAEQYPRRQGARGLHRKAHPNFPDIPTFREVGQDLVAATWFSLSGPARLPSDIVQKTSQETLKAMQLPEVQKRLALDAMKSRSMSPEEFTKFVEAETARWAPLAKQLAATNPQ